MRCLLILFFALQSVLPTDGESLLYNLRFKLGIVNTKVATANISLNPETYNGEEALYGHVTIRVQPFFRLFMSEKYLSYVYFSKEDKKPIYYYNLNNVGYTECYYQKDSIRYERHRGGEDVKITTVPNDGNTMEIFSFLFHMREIELIPGQSQEFSAYLFGDFRKTIVTMTAVEQERFPGRRAEALVVELPERGLMENGSGNIIYAWRDSEGTRPVLGIEVPLGKGKGTMIATLDYEL